MNILLYHHIVIFDAVLRLCGPGNAPAPPAVVRHVFEFLWNQHIIIVLLYYSTIILLPNSSVGVQALTPR